MKHIIVDFEMNPIVGSRRNIKGTLREEIIQIGAVMLDENYKEIVCFNRLVKPQYMSGIFSRIREITGITTEMVKGEDEFAKVFQEFLQWCNQYATNYRIYSWGDADIRQLKVEVKAKKIGQKQLTNQMITRWIDLQRNYMNLIGYKREISLVNALKDIEKEFVGVQHNALYDARNTAELLRFIRHQKRFVHIITPLRIKVEAINLEEEQKREELKRQRAIEKAEKIAREEKEQNKHKVEEISKLTVGSVRKNKKKRNPRKKKLLQNEK